MDGSSITRYITETFAEVETQDNYGYTFFFYRTERMLPFATLISADYEYDRVSNLDRLGIFRLNIGISRETFQVLFGSEKVDISSYDFSALNTIMPHPEYAAQFFVCVLSPSGETLEQVQQLLAEAYLLAAKKFNQRKTF